MRSLKDKVKQMSFQTRINGNAINFLDHAHTEPGCQRIIQSMNNISLNQLGIQGPEDPYHF